MLGEGRRLARPRLSQGPGTSQMGRRKRARARNIVQHRATSCNLGQNLLEPGHTCWSRDGSVIAGTLVATSLHCGKVLSCSWSLFWRATIPFHLGQRVGSVPSLMSTAVSAG